MIKSNVYSFWDYRMIQPHPTTKPTCIKKEKKNEWKFCKTNNQVISQSFLSTQPPGPPHLHFLHISTHLMILIHNHASVER